MKQEIDESRFTKVKHLQKGMGKAGGKANPTAFGLSAAPPIGYDFLPRKLVSEVRHGCQSLQGFLHRFGDPLQKWRRR
jgi:hypothetical protein